MLGEDGADDCVFWLSGAVGLFDAAETSWLRLLVVLGVVVPVTGTFELEMLLIEFSLALLGKAALFSSFCLRLGSVLLNAPSSNSDAKASPITPTIIPITHQFLAHQEPSLLDNYSC